MYSPGMAADKESKKDTEELPPAPKIKFKPDIAVRYKDDDLIEKKSER